MVRQLVKPPKVELTANVEVLICTTMVCLSSLQLTYIRPSLPLISQYGLMFKHCKIQNRHAVIQLYK